MPGLLISKQVNILALIFLKKIKSRDLKYSLNLLRANIFVNCYHLALTQNNHFFILNTIYQNYLRGNIIYV